MNKESKNLYPMLNTPVELLTDDTIHCQVLMEWNDTQADYPKSCIHHLFEAQVERSPDAVAVVFEDEQLTYRELNARANQLAHHLQSLGVGPNVLVGICVERSLEMVVGLLGILKAGGAYVPLDPAYPQERLEFMLQDTQVPVLLIQQLIEVIPKHAAQLIVLDKGWEALALNSVENPISSVTSNNLAYVLYTSGSTGQPKGVMISHSSICNQLCWRQTTFPLTKVDRVLQTISFSFDPSVWQIFWPLSFGAELIMARPGGHQDSAYLVKLIAKQQITVIALVPSMLRLFLEEKGLDECALRHVFCGGEALPVELQERFFNRLNLDDVLHNVYGPTEASIDATFWTCKRGTNYQIAPTGRPIANTQIYILDSYLQPVPVGVQGELHIGGVGLAQGYLNRPELTAEKFIPNPFSSESGTRLYKTGDLARHLPDGNIEFIGRIDQQLKIRGFRIELEEIEAALSQHPCVQQSIVVAREDVPGDKRLVAYYTIPSQKQAPTISELCRFLKEKLPDYMLPSAFVMLETLPLNTNGKIDRRALPAPQQERPALEESFVAPQDILELQLTKIWEEVLGIQPIGVRDNFFELGGNSLLAVRLFGQIEKTFGQNLRLTALLQTPTIEQLTHIIRSSGCDVPIQSLVQLKPGGNKPPLFCIYGLLLYHDLAHNLDPEQPVYGVYLQEEVDRLQANRLEQFSALSSVTNLASNYLKEIQTLQPEGPYFLAGESFGGLVAFEMAQQLHMQGEKVALLALFDTESPVSVKKLPWREWVSLHLKNLLQEGFTYTQKKVNQRILSIKPRLLRIIRTYSKFDPRSGQILSSYFTESQLDVRQQFYYQAFRNYVPRPYVGKVILFRAMTRDQFEASDPDPQFGWGKLAAGGLEVHHVPGDHLGILKQPHVRVLAEKLRACLEQAQVDIWRCCKE